MNWFKVLTESWPEHYSLVWEKIDAQPWLAQNSRRQCYDGTQKQHRLSLRYQMIYIEGFLEDISQKSVFNDTPIYLLKGGEPKVVQMWGFIIDIHLMSYN